MAISTLQNFFKTKIKVATTAIEGNIYVDTKPTATNGWLVISPGNESLREIVKYTGTGTDGTGDFIIIQNLADRGVGGTTAQTHTISEPVRMNYTAQHQQEIDDTINAIVTAGAPNASTTVTGLSRLSAAPVDPLIPISVGTNDTRMNVGAGMTANEKAALAGGGAFGTPSGSNKFLTEQFSVAPQVVIFTSSGTWTKNAGLKYVVVEVQGAGAGGAGEGGVGGGAGGYARKLIPAASLGATETVTIATGGAGATGAAGGDGSGATTFVVTSGVNVVANRGLGARTGGTATGGDVNITGQSGGNAGGGSNGFAQQGGDAMLGKGGASASGNSSSSSGGADGNAATGYGGGGSAARPGSDGIFTGGAGTPGIVIVTEYY